MKLSGVFSGFGIASSGMSVQRTRLNVIASNIANADTLETDDGGPYKKKNVDIEAVPVNKFNEIFSDKMELFTTNGKHFLSKNKKYSAQMIGDGVRCKGISESKSPPKLVYDPSNPMADKNGYVAKPNISPIDEMVKMIEAQRSYEANAASFASFKDMYKNSMNLI